MTTLEPFVKGKTVSIVANASSIIGNGDPGEIDGRDVVIRLSLLNPIPEQHKAWIGSRTDIIYCGWRRWDELVLRRKHSPEYWMYHWKDNPNDVRNFLGAKAIPKSKIVEDILSKKYDHLKKHPSRWSPTSGTMCFYDACISGAKEIYLTGYDFLRTIDRVCGYPALGKERMSIDGASNSHHDLHIDEIVLKDLIGEGYPIKLDRILTEIMEQV